MADIKLRASLDLLKVNVRREEVELLRRKVVWQDRMHTLISRTSDIQTRLEVENQVGRAMLRYWRAFANNHRMKLKALLLKEGHEALSIMETTPTLPSRVTMEVSVVRTPASRSRSHWETPPSSPQQDITAPTESEVANDALPCRGRDLGGHLATSTPLPGPSRCR